MSNTKFCGYDVHPAALIPGNLDADTYRRLRESILKSGQLVPVLVWKDQIVDGVHRAKICHEEGIGLKTVELPDDDSPTEAALAMMNRRDSTPSQRAAWAAEALPLLQAEAKERQKLSFGRGEKGKEKFPDLNDEEKGQARDKAAKAMKVNPRYVQDAKKIKEESPETFEKLKSGATTLQQAKKDLYGGSKAHEGGKDSKPAESAPEDKDPETLWSLKYHWRRATKKEKTAFLEWVNAEKTKPKAQ